MIRMDSKSITPCDAFRVGMIREIQLQNFQAHSDTTLELVPGINIITGTNQAGKTSIIRGFEWVRTSRPLGSSMIRIGSEKACSVRVVFAKNFGIERIRSKTRNEYKVAQERFKGVSSRVPAAVTKAFAATDLNVQMQFEPHYLIMESPGKFARIINETIHLEAMGVVSDECRVRIRSARSELIGLDDRIKVQMELLEQYKDLDQIDERTNICLKLVERYKNLDSVSKSLADLLKTTERQERIINDFPSEDAIKALEELVVESGRKREQALLLLKVVEEAEETEENVFRTIINEVKAKYKYGRIELVLKREEIEDVVNQLISTQSKLDSCTQSFEFAEQSYRSMLEKLKACPTCKRPMDEDTIVSLVEGA